MAERYHLGVNRNEHPTMFVCREPACEIARHFYLAVDYDTLAADRDQISLTLAVAKADRDKWFNRARYLEAALRSGIQLVEGLRVFGNDNIHKYDVPAWLGVVKGKLGIPVPMPSTPETGAEPK